MKKRSVRAFSFLLAATMMLTACGKDSASSEDEYQKREGLNGRKGVVVEEAVKEFPLDYSDKIIKDQDGNLIAYGYNNNDDKASVHVSKDKGVTWEKSDQYDKYINNNFRLLDRLIDGTTLWEAEITYEEGEEADIDYSKSTYLLVDKDGQEKTIELQAPELEQKYKDRYNGMGMSMSSEAIVVEDGEKVVDSEEVDEGEIDDYEPENSFYRALLIDKDTIIVGDSMGKTYQIDANTGAFTHTYEMESTEDFDTPEITIVGNYLLLVTYEDMIVYNLDNQQKEAVNPGLKSLVHGNSEFSNASMGTRTIAATDDGTNVIVFAETGIYKGDLLKGEFTLLVEAEYTSLAGTYIDSFVYLDQDNFIASFYGADQGVCRYFYTEDEAYLNVKTIRVYALTPYQTGVDEAIRAFNQKSPFVKAKLEIGITEDSTMTTTDAIKALNAEILAGNGPDILFLDGLDIDNYIEKGMLMDLTDTVNKVKESDGVFENIISTYKDNKSIYAVPLGFSVPVLVGEKDVIDKINDTESLLKEVENLSKNPTGRAKILGLYGQISALLYTADAFVPTWLNEDKTINKDGLKKHFETAKQLAELERPDKMAEEYGYSEKDYLNEMLEDEESNIDRMASEFFSYTGDYFSLHSALDEQYNKDLTLATISSIGELENYTNFSNNKGLENWGYKALALEASKVYRPQTIVAINAKSKMPNAAQTFIETVLGSDVQSNLLSLPVNKKAFEEKQKNPYPEDYDSRVSIGSSNGKEIEITVEWPTKEEFKEFEDLINSLETPSIYNSIVSTQVGKQALSYFAGKITIDEAIEEINKKINIYLSE